jgi:DNA-binding PadR family transcriptional regulator
MSRIPLLGRALLGLLIDAPLSGYDIRRLFTQTPLATFSDSPGAIYPALKRLEAAGFVRGRVERSAGLRQRRLFRVTPAGKAALESLRALQHELTTYLPELRRYLEANRGAMPLSGRLALESGIRAYDAMLAWTRDALGAYEKRGKDRRKS